jgi:hypothetical protein
MRIYLLGMLVLCSLSCLGQRSQRHERPRKPPVAASPKPDEEPLVEVRTIDDEPFRSTPLKLVSTIELDFGVINQASAVRSSSYKYPAQALRAQVEGDVIIHVLISEDGTVVAGFVRFDTPVYSKDHIQTGVIPGSGRDQLANYSIRLMAAEVIRATQKLRWPCLKKSALIERKGSFRMI